MTALVNKPLVAPNKIERNAMTTTRITDGLPVAALPATEMTLSQSFSTTRWQRRAVFAVVLCCICTYLPTIYQRGLYSDDFPNRQVLSRHGIVGAIEFYEQRTGFLRPMGYWAIFATHQYLWDYPAAQQGLLLALHVAVCLLVLAVAKRLTGDLATALLAACWFAAWPSYTSMVVWVAGGMQMLPAWICFLAAILCYLWHLNQSTSRRWWWAAWGLYTLSILFHDQHIGAVAVFSALALLLSPNGQRARRLAGTLPMWVVAVGVTVLTVTTAANSNRPLHPSLGGMITSFADAARQFADLSVVTAVQYARIGTGPAESLSRMLADDPQSLLYSLILLLLSMALIGGTLLNRVPLAACPPVQRHIMAVVGGLIFVAGLAIMASSGNLSVQPRHTFGPAVGLSMLLAAVCGWLIRKRGRLLVIGAVLVAIVGLTVIRLGHSYQWTIRTRATNQVLTELDRLYPQPNPGDLLIIDGIRHYGRGFADSWGLSAALTLRRGVELKVATFVRRDGDQLVANVAWDQPWPVDPDRTHCFRWRTDRSTLEPISLADYLARHPQLQNPPPRTEDHQ